MAYIPMAYIPMAYIPMAFIRMAYIRMAYIVMAYIVMAHFLCVAEQVLFPSHPILQARPAALVDAVQHTQRHGHSRTVCERPASLACAASIDARAVAGAAVGAASFNEVLGIPHRRRFKTRFFTEEPHLWPWPIQLYSYGIHSYGIFTEEPKLYGHGLYSHGTYGHFHRRTESIWAWPILLWPFHRRTASACPY